MQEMSAIKPRRSLLFIPANRPDRFDKALNSGADMVCLELEDGVAFAQKDMARSNMVDFFTKRPRLPAYPEILVRINGLEEVEGVADLEAILALPQKPAALMIPKNQNAGTDICTG